MTDFSILNITGVVIGIITLFLVLFPISGKNHSIKNIPIYLVAIGFLAKHFGLSVTFLDPSSDYSRDIILYLTEALVVIALAAAGLSINMSPTWKNWNPAYLLVLVTMPLMIALTAAFSYFYLGLNLATSILIGAVLAPTDPVLARTVQVDGPKDDKGEHPVKVALTAEAGLNDGLAFPFVYLAIVLSLSFGTDIGLETTILNWFLSDLIFKISIGMLGGLGMGLVWAKLAQKLSNKEERFEFFGLLMVGSTITTYFLTETLGGYGFLAVFIANVLGRRIAQKKHGKETLVLPHAFTDQIEILLTSVSLLWLGTFMAGSVIGYVSISEIIFGLCVVLLFRPITGFVGLIFSGFNWRQRVTASVLGVKGMGSVYYLSYSLSKGEFDHTDGMWRIVAVVILISILLHGFGSKKFIQWSKGEV